VASFAPFKAYIIESLDELIVRHGLTAPFLDVGCGSGDVAAHLARRGWSGTALEPSPVVRELACATLRPYPAVRISGEAIEAASEERFSTVIMLDVLEHVPDDRAVLAAVAAKQAPGAALVVTVPTNPEREWRWDDDVYGHLRRYRPADFPALLGDAGYRVAEMWDVSFPIFWLMRRGFTALKRARQVSGTAQERTALSAIETAWKLPLLSDLLSQTALWRLPFLAQRRFRHRLDRGFEMIVLAQRR
jgi:SAM-dependent methyltransferase